MLFDVTIVGAGVVGLSIGKFCSEQGLSVVVLEQESRAGEGISSRNSGVIHAGIYYPKDSLKTKFCISGNKILYEYAKHKRINHKKIGKYIIATCNDDVDKLHNIYQKGIENSVPLDFLSTKTIKEISEFFLAENISDLSKLSKQDLNHNLLSIFGIGPWSVNMFEIFSIGKLDVFSSKDAGLRLAMNNSGMIKPHSSWEMYDKYASKWSPFKTIASLHLWKTVD